MKCHNETPCVAILSKKKCLFPKTKDRKLNQILSGGWYQWEGGGCKEKEIRRGCKGIRRVNVVETLRTHACKWENETC
jgi:hypothetical protein